MHNETFTSRRSQTRCVKLYGVTYLNFYDDVSLVKLAAFQNDFVRFEFLPDNRKFTIIRSPIQWNDDVLSILPRQDDLKQGRVKG